MSTHRHTSFRHSGRNPEQPQARRGRRPTRGCRNNSHDDGDDDLSMTAVVDAAPLTSLASAVFFGSCIFATAALKTRRATLASGPQGDVASAADTVAATHGWEVSSLPSTYRLLSSLSQLGLILWYAYLCENHPPFAHSDKSYDRDQVFFLTLLLLVISAWTVQPNILPSRTEDALSRGKSHSRLVYAQTEETDVLNRKQTEEWKGW